MDLHATGAEPEQPETLLVSALCLAGFCLPFWHDISIAIEFSAVHPCERWVVFNVVLRCLSTCWGFPFHPSSPAAVPGSDCSLLGEAVPCEGHSHGGCWHHLLPSPFPSQSKCHSWWWNSWHFPAEGPLVPYPNSFGARDSWSGDSCLTLVPLACVPRVFAQALAPTWHPWAGRSMH